jgi:hypothetical protein
MHFDAPLVSFPGLKILQWFFRSRGTIDCNIYEQSFMPSDVGWRKFRPDQP